VLDYPVPAGRGNRAGGELGCPKSLSKNMLKVAVFIVPFLLPSGRRIGPRYQGVAKSRLTQKCSIRNIAKMKRGNLLHMIIIETVRKLTMCA
jgi:hypothetical protein